MAGPTNKGIERPKNDPKGKKDRQKKLEERKAAFDKRQFNSEKEKEEEQLALRTEEAAIEAMEVDNSSADSGDASTGDPPIKGEEVQQPLESIPAASTGGGGTNLNTESNGGAGGQATSSTDNSNGGTNGSGNPQSGAATGQETSFSAGSSTDSRATTPASDGNSEGVTEPKSESDPKVKKYDSEDWLEKINAKLADLNVSDFKDLEEKKEEAEKNAKQLYEKFEKLSVTEQRKEAKNLEKARDAYKRALAALEFARLNSETEEIETDDIAKGKVEAKQISSMSSHALVRIGREKAAVYRIVPKKSVDQTQWDGADEFKDLRPLKLSPAEANDILGVAFRGDADSFTAAFNIRHELRPVKSKPSDPTSRPTRPRMWIYGKRENGRFWLLPRTSWANIASRSADKATDIALGIAERQLKRFLLDLETGRSVDLDDIGEDKRPLREQTVGMDDHTKRDVSPPRTLDSIEHSPEPEGNKASETVLPSTET